MMRLILMLACIGFPMSNSMGGALSTGLISPDQLVADGGIPKSIANEYLKLFAIYTVHRPYSGATSISTSNTFDLNVEATAVKIGDGLFKAIGSNGNNPEPPDVPAFPIAKLNLRRGFSENFDAGLSGLFIENQKIWGVDLKFVLYDPDEGPSFALRLAYSYISIREAYVADCSTIAPEFVMSRRLTFAEPYLGVGMRFISGTIDIPIHDLVSSVVPVNVPDLQANGSAIDEYAFTGIYFRLLGATGLRFGIEGSFDMSGYHTIGTVIGMGF